MLFTNHKWIIFEACVISSHYNWTKKARYNNESIDIKHSREATEPYVTKFIKLKNRFNLFI